MRELGGHSTFLIGLRIDEDGDLRFAVGDSVIEICFTFDDELLAMREVGVAEVASAQVARRDAHGGPE